MKLRIFTLSSLCLSLSSAVAWAQPNSADALFERGRAAMSNGDYATACKLFNESHRIDPAPGTQLNLSVCEEKQGKLIAALRDLQDVLAKLPKGDVRVPVAEKELDSLKAKIPTVTVTLDASSAGARIARDGVALPADAIGRPLQLDPGAHVFIVTADGRPGSRRDVVLKEGEQVSLTLSAGALREGEVAAKAPTPVVVHDERDANRRLLGVGALAVGGVGIVTGVVTGLMTASAASSFKDHCRTGCDAEANDAASRGKTMGIVSPIAFGVGAIGAGVGSYLLLTSKKTARTGWTVAPQLSARDAGVSLAGTF